MAIEITLDSPLPPAALLAAIREDAREWRESLVPDELRRGGVIQLEGRVRHASFRLWLARGWTASGGDPLELRGVVTPTPEGGSRITARCGRRGGLGWIVALLLALAGGIWVSDGSGAGLLVVLAGVVAAIRLLNDRGVARDTDAEARFLVERLERAIAQAGTMRGADSRVS